MHPTTHAEVDAAPRPSHNPTRRGSDACVAAGPPMKMQKVRVNENDSGVVDCDKCGKPIQVTDLSRLADANNIVRVTCSCGAVTEAQYERRAFLRLLSNRPGVYRSIDHPETTGAMTIVDTSVSGVRFRTSGDHSIQMHDRLVIEYDAGLPDTPRLRHEVIVQRIDDHLIGARLADSYG